ncbi:MAG TPA: protein-methionine-sulfoxide reductase catalytic subunit MsrP [Bryobacteraceae bacterium]|nr:protein-methionine-sulfoxide reductase catalytic subunit MsrP [Bryobacteraceae bacterium]
MLIREPQGWEIPEREATPEAVYWNRRQILSAAGLLSVPSLAGQVKPLYPAAKNEEFNVPADPLTPEWAATGYNNYYEFDPYDKQNVQKVVGKFVTSPWTIKVTGLVKEPQTYDLDALLKKFPLQERVYRFRCVERWAMVVPWSGFPLASFIKMVEPKAEAKFVRFLTASRPNEMPGMKQAPYPWPYFEGLRMDEAMHPLTLLATGLYGKPMPKQNGAPIRIVTPWKYGYKSPKSIVQIEFTAKEPPTFWNRLQSAEYGFYSNVEPKKPHPRWSQAMEQMIPTMERRPTQQYNGYEKFVAGLYNGKEF